MYLKGLIFFFKDIQDKSSKIHEMASVMRRAIDIDDTNSASQEERINALLLENRGLKEILAVHENIHRPKPVPTTTTIEVCCSSYLQTHEFFVFP